MANLTVDRGMLGAIVRKRDASCTAFVDPPRTTNAARDSRTKGGCDPSV
jgi:hypothetical protein